MKKVYLKSLLLALIIVIGATTCWAGSKVSVNSLAELMTKLADPAVSTVVVVRTIDINEDVTIDGQGKSVQVVSPFCNASGNVQEDYSTYNVFNVNAGTLTLKNMQIFGGYVNGGHAGGIFLDRAAELYAENVIIARSGRALYVSTAAKAVLKNCDITLNACDYGGGVLIDGKAFAIFDGCSISKNRSLATNGGGGAMEVRSTIIVNNSVIADNSSTEIGGAINLCGGNVYMLNSTVTGNCNVTNYAGGGIGINYGDVYAVNSIFLNNYHFKNGNKVKSDIGNYQNLSGNYGFYNCVYGGLENINGVTEQGDGYTIEFLDCKEGSETSEMVAYQNKSIFYMGNSLTPEYPHSILLKKNGGIFSLYAPILEGSTAATGGVNTYLDYSDMSDIKIGYGTDDNIQKLSDTYGLPTTDAKVTTYYEGGTRAAGIIGASAPCAAGDTYYTVKILAESEYGYVTGASFLGDTYTAGSSVTLTATPYDGCVFKEWQDNNGVQISTANPYTFTIDADMTILPVFEDKSVTVTINENKNLIIYGLNSKGKYMEGEQANIIAVPNAGYKFLGWKHEAGDAECFSTDNPLIITVNANMSLYPVVEYYGAKVIVHESDLATVDGVAEDGQYTIGDQATITAVPTPRSIFKGWKHTSEDTECFSTENPLNITVTEDINIYPDCEKIELNFLAAPGYVGTVDKDEFETSYPWIKDTSKEGAAFMSSNYGIDDTESISVITIIPSEDVPSYRLSFDWKLSSEADINDSEIYVYNDNIEEDVIDYDSEERNGSYISDELTEPINIGLYYYNDENDGRLYIYNIKCTPISSYDNDMVFFDNKKYDGATDVMKLSAWDAYSAANPNVYGYSDNLEGNNLFVKKSETSYSSDYITVTDGYDFILPKAIADKQNTAATAVYTRKLENEWGTMVLPFSVPSSSEDYDMYTLTAVSDDKITVSKVLDENVAAGTPVLVHMKESTKDSDGKYLFNISATNCSINTTGNLEGSSVGNLTMKGSYITNDITDENGYIIANNKLWSIQDVKGTDNVYNAPLRAYFASSSVLSDKVLDINIGEITAVDAINAIVNGEAAYYDLNGRRIPMLRQGINIVKQADGNTVKVVVK